MKPRTVEADFLAFQRQRSTEALGRVFDATAPKLLLVAMHLCRDAAAAEDLVQAVFLQVLRDADQHRPGRPLMPWLLGILQHRAQDQRTATARRTARERAAAVRPHAVAEPPDAAMDGELREAVAQALEAVPGDYRSLLTLRLVHGLRAVDIAHSLGIPAATVRTRLRRGLALLRRALPRGLAAPAIAALIGREALALEDRLPAIRGAVLRAAADAAAPAAGTALGWGLACCVLALVTTVAGLAIRAWTQAPRPVPTATTGAAVDAAREGRGSAETAGAVTSGSGAAGPRRERAARPAAPRGSVLRGRVVAAENGAPIVGAEVSLGGIHDPGRGRTPAEPWSAPEVVRTDGGGRFSVRVEPPPTFSFALRIETADRVPLRRGIDALTPGEDLDLGTLALRPGTPVEVEVTVDGTPTAGIAVLAGPAPRDASTRSMRAFGTTDLAGRLRFGPLPPGRWAFEIDGAFGGETAGHFAVPATPTLQVVRIALSPPDPERSLRGILVDAGGAPVPDVGLRLRTPGGFGFVEARTGRDGSFAVTAARPAPGAWRFELPGDRRDLEWLDDGGEVLWGTGDLRLVVRRRVPGQLHLEVVDGATGAPVTRYAATCWPEPSLGGLVGLRMDLGPLADHAEGRCAFVDLAPGAYRVTVRAGLGLAERGDVAVSIDEGRRRDLRIELLPPRTLDVAVRYRDDGAAAAGVTVELAKVLPEDRWESADLTTYRTDLADARRGAGASTGANVFVLDRAIADARGTAQLALPPNTPALVTVVTGPGCVPELVRCAELPAPGTPLELEVSRAGGVRGRLGPDAFVRRYGPASATGIEAAEAPGAWPSICLRPAGSEGTTRCPVDAEGRFAAQVPPGTYEVHVEVSVRPDAAAATDVTFGPLATITVEGGAETELELDASDHVPGRLALSVFVDGEAWHGEAGVVRVDGGERASATHPLRHGSGAARIPAWLPPGRYLPYVRIPVRPNVDRTLYGPEPIDLAPGGEASATAAIERRTLVVTVLDADGDPVIGRRVVPRALDPTTRSGSWRYGEHTDARGRAVFDPAPPGRLTLHAFAEGQDPRDEAAGVPLGEVGPTQGEVTVRLAR